jgi:ABC-type antimicrobial peptide transport system permease subunit
MDVPTFLIAAALLTAVSLIACIIPTFRAIQVDTVRALHGE